MATLRVGRKSLAKGYADRTGALLKMVSDLPDRPSPDEVHDLRVAVRRIQVMRRLMPRSVRSTQDSKTFNLALKSVLKATSQLRDMDTLMVTLKSCKGNLPAGLLVSQENQRSDSAARAKVTIGTLADVKVPELDTSKLRGRRLSRRFRKGVRGHSNKASLLLTQVLNDESKMVELHSLRKEVKKMRYLLELAAKTPARLPSLAKWQESLGAIHDLDVAIAYLKGVGAGSGRGAILELQRARHSNYLTFVRAYRADQMQALGEGGAPSVGAPAPASLRPTET
jgi:CHAD domain-containing protein